MIMRNRKIDRVVFGFITFMSIVLTILLDRTHKFGIEGYYPTRRYNYSTIGRRLLGPRSSPSTRPISHCDVMKHVVYIKTHKTGSTTLETIFNRFGFYHNSSFIFNKHDIFGHFESMDLRKDDVVKHLLPPLGVKEGDYERYKNYDSSAIHVRFYRDILDQFLASGTRYVSSVRDPADQWESAFNHFEFRKVISKLADDNGQMIIVNDSLKLPFDKHNSTLDAIIEFLRQPEVYIDALKKRGDVIWHFSHNDQTFDLCPDLESSQLDNDALINRTIDRLDDELDFVIVNEYFDESLLVMKKEFWWNFTDILYIPQNKRAVKEMLPEETRAKIRAFNRADTLLHRRFNDSLWKKISAYGPDFQKDLNHFRQLLIDVKSDCSEEGKSFHKGSYYKVVNIKAKTNATLFCHLMADFVNGSFTRVYQRQRDQN